jgi:hypothetical protein
VTKWKKLTRTDGRTICVNLENARMVIPYQDGAGHELSAIAFDNHHSVNVKETPEQIQH